MDDKVYRHISAAAIIISVLSLALTFILYRQVLDVHEVANRTIFLTATVMAIMYFLGVEFARRGRKTQDLFTLMDFLHRTEFREARRIALAPKWDSSKDNVTAWIICSSFDFAGLMVEKRFVNRKVFLYYWAPPVYSLGLALDKFLSETTLGLDNQTGKV